MLQAQICPEEILILQVKDPKPKSKINNKYKTKIATKKRVKNIYVIMNKISKIENKPKSSASIHSNMEKVILYI